MRPARESDVDEVHKLAVACSIVGKRDSYLRELQTAFSIFIVAECLGQLAGFVVAWNVAGEIQLNTIAVNESYRRQGIGSALIEDIVDRLWKVNPSRIYLEVREKNQAARSFYNKNGFYETGLRKNYYLDDNAILLTKDIV